MQTLPLRERFIVSRGQNLPADLAICISNLRLVTYHSRVIRFFNESSATCTETQWGRGACNYAQDRLQFANSGQQQDYIGINVSSKFHQCSARGKCSFNFFGKLGKFYDPYLARKIEVLVNSISSRYQLQVNSYCYTRNRIYIFQN